MKHAPARGFSLVTLLVIAGVIAAGAVLANGQLSDLAAAVVSSSRLTPSVSTVSLKVTSPNGGESVTVGSPTTITWSMVGLTNPVSIGIYKDGQLYAWIDKNVNNDKATNNTYSYSWTPKSIPAGSGYQIHVQGKRATGTKVVEDKSDASFTLVAAIKPQKVCGLFRGGTSQADHMIASPNPQNSVADTDAACIQYCDQSGAASGDICMRGTSKIKVYPKVTSYPDLISVPIAYTTFVLGGTTTLTSTIMNIGKVASGPSQVAFQVAKSSTGSGAQNIDFVSMAELRPDGSRRATATYRLPDTKASYYIRACADMGPKGGEVTESNEQNNCGPWTAITTKK